jgi:uncharacterized protein YegP (UPF0339 family)
MMGGVRFELYRSMRRLDDGTSVPGDTYFRIVAANGQIIAQSEGYKNESDALHTIKLIQAKAPIAAVMHLTEKRD